MTKILLFVFGLFFSGQFILNAQYLNFNNYSVRDGLAQSQVFDVTEDHKGYIWLATQGGGVSRFDGIKFDNFDKSNGLYSNYVNVVFQDENTRLWIGTSDGLNVYTDSIYKIPSSTSIKILSIDQYQDIIYVGTSAGLFSYQNDSLLPVDEFFNKSINGIEVYESKLYLASNDGLYFLSNQKVVKIAHSAHRITSLLNYKGNLLVGTYGNNLLVLRNGNLKKTAFTNSIYGNVILGLEIDQSGKLWVGTLLYGVYAFENNYKFDHFDVTKGLSNNHVRCIIEDSWSNIWIGTSGGGVSKYSGALFSHYNQTNGLNGNFVYDVLVDKKNRVWVTTSGLGVNVMTDTNVYELNQSNGFHDVKTKTIFEDSRGNIWLGTEGKGLGIVPDSISYMDSIMTYTTNDGLSGNWIRSFAELDSVIYIGTAGGGITRAIPSKESDFRFSFEALSLKEGKFPSRINDLEVDYKRRLWMASEYKGVYYLKSGFLHSVKLPIKDMVVRSLMANDTMLWLGTSENGLFYCKLNNIPLEIKKFEENDQLLSQNIYLLQKESNTEFWVGTEKGVNKLISNDGEYDILAYGINEGFTGIETCRNASFADQTGKVWFGTINGLTVYNPVETYYSYIAPKLHIKDVKLFYTSFGATHYRSDLKENYWINGFELNYDENHISFEFDGIDHSQPLGVKYSYVLEGFEDQWSPWSERDVATYSNLNPGTYTFKLRTKGYSEAIRENKPITFTIKPPFWRTLWFIMAVSFSGVALLSFIFWRFYVRIRNKSRQQQEALMKDKTILELEQKALRLQMNPHFIFHVLSSIRGDYKKNDPKAENHLIAFSRLMRLVLENSRKSKISIEDELETLELYLELEKETSSKDFNYEINIQDDVEISEPVLPPLLLQPFVENSIIHGFRGLERKGNIKIDFKYSESHLVITIQDNGIGRDRAKSLLQQKEVEHKSAALEITQQRLSLLNDHNTSLVIENVIDDGEVSGTIVKINIPVLSNE